MYIEYSINVYEHKYRIEEEPEDEKEEQQISPVSDMEGEQEENEFSRQVDNEDEPELTPVRPSANKQEKIINFIQGIIRKPYLKGRNSNLSRNKSHSITQKSSEDIEEEEKKIDIRFNRNTKFIEDSDSEENIEDEPKINLLRSNKSVSNPFAMTNYKFSVNRAETPKSSERELSLEFYNYATLNHKKLFDNLRQYYQEWKEGIDSFNKMDLQNPTINFHLKTYDKKLESLLLDSLQLIRNNSSRDPIYDQYQTNYEDVYYHPFDESDEQLRKFLLDENSSDVSSEDFDVDFGEWL